MGHQMRHDLWDLCSLVLSWCSWDFSGFYLVKLNKATPLVCSGIPWPWLQIPICTPSCVHPTNPSTPREQEGWCSSTFCRIGEAWQRMSLKDVRMEFGWLPKRSKIGWAASRGAVWGSSVNNWQQRKWKPQQRQQPQQKAHRSPRLETSCG